MLFFAERSKYIYIFNNRGVLRTARRQLNTDELVKIFVDSTSTVFSNYIFIISIKSYF